MTTRREVPNWDFQYPVLFPQRSLFHPPQRPFKLNHPTYRKSSRSKTHSPLPPSTGLNFGTSNQLHSERESSESDTKSWNSAESFDLSETINMNWLDDDYTLTSLDDDLFKLDSSYHQNGCLPSLDDLSLPSFYTSSINANFKLDSKEKGERVPLFLDVPTIIVVQCT